MSIDAFGRVTLKQTGRVTYWNFGDPGRAAEFAAKRLAKYGSAEIKMFYVPEVYLRALEGRAIEQEEARLYPTLPFRVDKSMALNQYGLRPTQLAELQCAIIQGTGGVISYGA